MPSLQNALLDAYVRSIRAREKHKLTHAVLRQVWGAARRSLTGDLRCRFLDRNLALPAGHALPVNHAYYPDYSMNLGRLGRLIQAKHADMTAVDIGANVGDSVLIWRHFASFPILAVEGDPRFFDYLVRNVGREPDVELERSFIGDRDQRMRGRLQTAEGTGKLVLDGDPDEEAGGVQLRRLASVIADHPRFAAFRLLKIDTDGFDSLIVRSSLDLLARTRAALFLEYDPYFLEQRDPDPLGLFADLARTGYARFLAYDNFGLLLVTGDVADRRLVEDLHRAFSGWNCRRYLDLCVFHAEDEDLFETIRASEYEHFRSIDKRLHFRNG